MSLSPEQKYIKSGGSKCPVCDSTSITGCGSIELDDGAWQNVECENCGATWTDIYTLTGITDLKEATK